MLDNRFAVAVVGGACVLAAGTGAFMATRMNATSERAVAAAASPEPALVRETEALIAPPQPAVQTPLAEAPRVAQAEPRPAPRRTVDRAAVTPTRASAPAAARPSPPAARPVPQSPSPRIPEPTMAQDLPFSRPIEVREPPADPLPRYEELVIPSESVIGLQIDGTVSSETAQVEDQVEARVTRDVLVGSRVALPTGSRAIGHVTMVDRGGKMKERARLAVRFHTLVLADGTTVPMQTDTVFREGDSPAAASSAKIGGGAIGGAVIGAILGGTKGAVIGGTTGAAGGTAAVMAGGRKPATLQGGSTVTVRVLSPVSVTVER